MNKSNDSFEIVHLDGWEPSPIDSLFGYRYFVTFVDDYSRCAWVYLLKSKVDVFSNFFFYHKMIETQFTKKIKILHSDNGGEYLSFAFHSYLDQHDIIHQTICTGTPKQNGVAECKNMHLMETIRALMFEMNVPKVF